MTHTPDAAATIKSSAACECHLSVLQELQQGLDTLVCEMGPGRRCKVKAMRSEEETHGVVLLPGGCSQSEVCTSLLASDRVLNTTGRAGLGNSAADYTALATSLQERGLVVETTAVARLDWARNAAGLADPAWWRGTLSPRPTVDWCRPALCSPTVSYLASLVVAEGRSL